MLLGSDQTIYATSSFSGSWEHVQRGEHSRKRSISINKTQQNKCIDLKGDYIVKAWAVIIQYDIRSQFPLRMYSIQFSDEWMIRLGTGFAVVPVVMLTVWRNALCVVWPDDCLCRPAAHIEKWYLRNKDVRSATRSPRCACECAHNGHTDKERTRIQHTHTHIRRANASMRWAITCREECIICAVWRGWLGWVPGTEQKRIKLAYVRVTMRTNANIDTQCR